MTTSILNVTHIVKICIILLALSNVKDVFPKPSPGSGKKRLVCTYVYEEKGDEECSLCVYLINLDYSGGEGVYTWYILDKGGQEGKHILHADGNKPFRKIEGKVTTTDSTIIFEGKIEPEMLKQLQSVPDSLQKEAWGWAISKRKYLKKKFVRYVVKNYADTVWVEEGTNHIFTSVKKCE